MQVQLIRSRMRASLCELLGLAPVADTQSNKVERSLSVERLIMTEVGCQLKNGARVIRKHRSSVTGRKTVLAEWSDSIHPYVTWRMDEQGNLHFGHYFKTYDQALADYFERT